MQLHRPSTFGVGMQATASGGGLTLTPYDGWAGPVSDRVSATRQLAWVDARAATQLDALHRTRHKQALLTTGGADAFGLEGAAGLHGVRELEFELRTLEGERRSLQRKLASLDRKDREHADAEEAKRHRYHKLTNKRTSVIAMPLPGPIGRHTRRVSVMPAPVFVPGFDPNLASQVVQDAPDLNLDSQLDQELFLERVAARVKRDSAFELQFGGLALAGAPDVIPQARGRRGSALSMARRSHGMTRQQFIVEESDEDEEDEESEEDVDTTDSSDSSDEDAKPMEPPPRGLDRRVSTRALLSRPVVEEKEQQMVVAPPPPRRRPFFLTQAAELSASDLSHSLQNYLTHSLAPTDITATEALIDPHLREKLSKALSAYIKSSAAAALESLETMDSLPVGTVIPPSAPSLEEQLLWGLLMGTLRNEEEEALALEWWADREKQLFAETAARQRRQEDAHSQRRRTLRRQASSRPDGYMAGDMLFSLDGLQLQLGADHAAHLLAGHGPSSVHLARGALLNALSIRQEQLRQLRGGQLLAQMALKAALEAQRLKEHARTHGLAGAALVPMPTPVAVSTIEPMCRRFVLSVVSSALANAGILQKQERTIRDLKWAISKARRVKQLTANGSINRPPEMRPKWISAVSQPTLMPKLEGGGATGVLQFIVVEPETSPTPPPARIIIPARVNTANANPSQPRAPDFVQSLSQAVQAASKAAYIPLPGSEGELGPDRESIPALPERDVRPGRGWTDPLYTPVPFDAAATEAARRKGLDVAYPPPQIAPQRKVIKQPATPALRFLGGDDDDDSDAEAAFAGMPPEVPEDEETRAAVASWTEMRAREEAHAAALAAARGRQGSASSLTDDGWGGFASNRTSQRSLHGPAMPTEDPSLLGSPPALHVSPAIVDEWALFVRSLDAASLAAKAAGSLSRSDALTGGAVKDPTNKSSSLGMTANERFAAGATVAMNPFADIPQKHLPRGAYHGLTPAHPHPDRQADSNAWILARSRALTARARKLAAAGDGGQAAAVLQASRASLDAQFHSFSNSWDWLPIDPKHPARKCHANCEMHYAVDKSGATVENPLGHAHVHQHRPASAAVSRSPTRPASPTRRPATAARKPAAYASATSTRGATGGAHAVRTVISLSPRRATSPSPKSSPSPSPSPSPPPALSRPTSSAPFKRKVQLVRAPHRPASALAAIADFIYAGSIQPAAPTHGGPQRRMSTR